MECQDVRRQLAAGIRPAVRPPERAQLGFHIANCADCFALLEVFKVEEQRQLLASLLAEPVVATPSANIAQAKSGKRRWPLAVVGMLLVLGLGGGWWWWSTPAQVVGVQAEPSPSPQSVAAGGLGEPNSVPVIQPSATLAATALPQATATIQASATAKPSSTPRPTATPQPLEQMTIAILGLDRRPGETEPARADALLILHLNPSSQSAALVSLPRDLWVALPPEYGFSVKLNAAYMYGEGDSNDAQAGAELARQTLSTTIGQPIDAVIVTTFEEMITMVDLIGGIEVDVAKEIYDSRYPTFDYGYMEAHFLPGVQHMDGATALIYSRTRHADNDFERGKRQQQVLLAIFARLQQLIQSNDNVATIELVGSLYNTLEYTSIDLPTILRLVLALQNFEPSTIQRESIDLNYGYETSTSDGAYIIQPDLPAIQARIAELFK